MNQFCNDFNTVIGMLKADITKMSAWDLVAVIMFGFTVLLLWVACTAFILKRITPYSSEEYKLKYMKAKNKYMIALRLTEIALIICIVIEMLHH